MYYFINTKFASEIYVSIIALLSYMILSTCFCLEVL